MTKSKKKLNPTQRRSGAFRKSKALPLPERRIVGVDDTPTPAIYLSWRDLSERMDILSDQFKTQCLRFQKHPLKMDLELSKRCANLADLCERIKGRINNWPSLTEGAVAGERSWVVNKYVELLEELAEIKNLER